MGESADHAKLDTVLNLLIKAGVGVPSELLCVGGCGDGNLGGNCCISWVVCKNRIWH